MGKTYKDKRKWEKRRDGERDETLKEDKKVHRKKVHRVDDDDFDTEENGFFAYSWSDPDC